MPSPVIPMQHAIDDLRIRSANVVDPPLTLEAERPISDAAADLVYQTRQQILKILNFDDRRLIVVVGPCSIHDTTPRSNTPANSSRVAAELAQICSIIMRVYFEKPRTTIGWKGLINDPHLDGTLPDQRRPAHGPQPAARSRRDGRPRRAREFLDMISPQYFADAGELGRHRRAHDGEPGASPAPSAASPARSASRTAPPATCKLPLKRSSPRAIRILPRPHEGGADRPSLRPPAIRTATSSCAAAADAPTTTLHGGAYRRQMEKAGFAPRIMIDCSHANSRKDHTRQALVCRDVAAQIAARRPPHHRRHDRKQSRRRDAQKHIPGKPLVYGQSITDACIGWDDTTPLLRELAAAVRTRG